MASLSKNLERQIYGLVGGNASAIIRRVIKDVKTWELGGLNCLSARVAVPDYLKSTRGTRALARELNGYLSLGTTPLPLHLVHRPVSLHFLHGSSYFPIFSIFPFPLQI